MCNTVGQDRARENVLEKKCVLKIIMSSPIFYYSFIAVLKVTFLQFFLCYENAGGRQIQLYFMNKNM